MSTTETTEKTTTLKFVMLRNGVSVQCHRLPKWEAGDQFTKPFPGTLIFPKHSIHKKRIVLNVSDITLMA